MVNPRAGKQFAFKATSIVSVEFVGTAPTKARGTAVRKSMAREGDFILNEAVLSNPISDTNLYSV